jgi:hypothetical protein
MAFQAGCVNAPFWNGRSDRWSVRYQEAGTTHVATAITAQDSSKQAAAAHTKPPAK